MNTLTYITCHETLAEHIKYFDSLNIYIAVKGQLLNILDIDIIYSFIGIGVKFVNIDDNKTMKYTIFYSLNHSYKLCKLIIVILYCLFYYDTVVLTSYI